MIELETLPKGWTIAKLGEIVITEKGKKPKRVSRDKTDECSIPYVNIKAFEKNIIDEYTDGVGCVLCEDDDFLMVWDGSRSGYVGKAIKGALGSTLVRIKLPLMNQDYVYYFLQSKFVEINTRAKGVGIPHVDPHLLWNYDFPIAPLPEQTRILAKLEQLLTDLDKGIEYLTTAQQQLKVYRQAVLKWAFDVNSISYKIEDLSKAIFAGGDMPKKYFSIVETEELKIPVYANAIPNNGLLGYTKEASVNDKAVTIAARGSGTGHVELREKPFLPIVRLITIIPNTEIVSIKYLYYFLKSLLIKGGGSAIPQLTIPMVKQYQIKIPSLSIQNTIVSEIESRLSVCDKIEETIAGSLQQAEALRLSIIKKAFEGKLVPQDPNDEPAEKLLERIRALRQAQGKQGNGEPKKKEKVKKSKNKVLVNG